MKNLNQQGVSLIELVIVMIVFSMLAVPLSKNFLSVSKSILINEDVNIATNLTLACAEHILYKRRSNKIATFIQSPNSTECDANANFAANGNLNITSNTTAPLCPLGTSRCDEITITGNNNSGQVRSTISMFLIYN